MQLFLEVLNDVLEFREIFRGRLDQGRVSFQHRLRPSGAVFFQRYWKSLPVLFYGAHAYVEKLVQPQATQRFRVSLIEMTTDKQPSPSSPSHNEIPASVPINVESITGQLHRSTMNSRASRWIISLAKSLRAVLFVDEPFPSTRTQTMRSAQLTNISDPGFIALSHVVRCCSPKASNTFASSPRSPMIFRTGAGDSLINVGVARI